MPRWFRWPFGRRRDVSSTPVDGALAGRSTLTAAATVIGPDETRRATERRRVGSGRDRLLTPQTDTVQAELWDYLDTLGEFSVAVTWRSNMISRVRLRAGRLLPDSDEPKIVETGPAADLMKELAGGTGGQSDLLAALSVFLDVPGEGWLTGEVIDGQRRWLVRSADELRARYDHYEVIDERSSPGHTRWRVLGGGSPEWYVTRIWRPSRRFRHVAWSPARAARSAMRELELANRKIQAQYLSRLATAGIFVVPDEVTFPTREEFQDAPDPFMEEWIELGSEAIRRPGTASAVLPLPMRVPGEWADKLRFAHPFEDVDDRSIEKREAALKRVVSLVNVPTDLLLNAGNVNHWGLAQLEEAALKTYVLPDVETMTAGLTLGYLQPLLRSAGVPDWADYVVWPDASEITAKPDQSDNAQDAYDRLEISGRVYRRAKGFNEDDAPNSDELNKLVLKRLASNPQIGFLALSELTGLTVDGVPDVDAPDDEPVDARDAGDDGDGDGDTSTPATRGDAAPADAGASPTRAATDRDALAVLQASSRHVVELRFGESPRLQHPDVCRERQWSCPFAHVVHGGLTVHPGTPGRYECWLTRDGELSIGRRVFDRFSELTPVPIGGVNGHAR